MNDVNINNNNNSNNDRHADNGGVVVMKRRATQVIVEEDNDNGKLFKITIFLAFISNKYMNLVSLLNQNYLK